MIVFFLIIIVSCDIFSRLWWWNVQDYSMRFFARLLKGRHFFAVVVLSWVGKRNIIYFDIFFFLFFSRL